MHVTFMIYLFSVVISELDNQIMLKRCYVLFALYGEVFTLSSGLLVVLVLKSKRGKVTKQ